MFTEFHCFFFFKYILLCKVKDSPLNIFDFAITDKKVSFLSKSLNALCIWFFPIALDHHRQRFLHNSIPTI